MSKDGFPHQSGRRRFLRVGAAAGMVPLLGATASGAHAAGEPRMSEIPRTGEKVPAVGLGSYQTFDVDVDSAEIDIVAEVLRLFAERGGRMVDSSPMYGRAEAAIGVASQRAGLGTRRFFYATKVWTSGRRAGIEQMTRSFRLFGVEVMDLMQVHNLQDTNTHLKAMREWRDAGRLRYLGVTHYTSRAFDELERVLRENRDVDFVQFPYSIVGREAEKRLIPVARELGVAMITHRNFEQGSLFRRVRAEPLPAWAAEFDCASWGNFFLKYVLGEPGITNVIPATRKPRHLDDNMNAGLGALPDAGQRKSMRELLDGL